MPTESAELTKRYEEQRTAVPQHGRRKLFPTVEELAAKMASQAAKKQARDKSKQEGADALRHSGDGAPDTYECDVSI